MDTCRDPKGHCGEPAEPVNPIKVAILVIVAALLIYYIARSLRCLGGARERFASKRAQEIYDRAREVFAEGGDDAPYSNYKKKVPDADPVQYSDVRRLFREGKMSPYSVESVI